MSIFKRVLAAHEYEVRGEKKTSWKEVGIITQNDRGNMFLSLHHLPGQKFNLFAPDPPKTAQTERTKAPRSFDDVKDDVPF